MIVYVGMYSTTIYPFNKQLVWDSLNPVSVGEDVNVWEWELIVCINPWETRNTVRERGRASGSRVCVCVWKSCVYRPFIHFLTSQAFGFWLLLLCQASWPSISVGENLRTVLERAFHKGHRELVRSCESFSTRRTLISSASSFTALCAAPHVAAHWCAPHKEWMVDCSTDPCTFPKTAWLILDTARPVKPRRSCQSEAQVIIPAQVLTSGSWFTLLAILWESCPVAISGLCFSHTFLKLFFFFLNFLVILFELLECLLDNEGVSR